MDISTIFGLLFGIACILLGGMGGFELEPAKLRLLLDVPAMLIVGGGGLASLFIATPMHQVIKAGKLVIRMFLYPLEEPAELIERLVRFAEIARRDGVLALESVAQTVDDDFLKKGIQLAVDGTDPETIEQILATDIAMAEERHSEGRKFFEIPGKYAPAWGLCVTLMGQIQMLAKLDDPNAIGPAMAVALCGTFYGCLIANFICLPAADKMETRNKEETLRKNIVLAGVLAIQAGDNPRAVEQKLLGFLPAPMRARIEEKRRKAA
jgi:chemotaxis protein MotA